MSQKVEKADKVKRQLMQEFLFVEKENSFPRKRVVSSSECCCKPEKVTKKCCSVDLDKNKIKLDRNTINCKKVLLSDSNRGYSQKKDLKKGESSRYFSASSSSRPRSSTSKIFLSKVPPPELLNYCEEQVIMKYQAREYESFARNSQIVNSTMVQENKSAHKKA
ncbi:uncharacterized protein [Prorops nasuta]|uniref:uncharacterized protein n=1 Tax=Prorops nasuta TaxID=863751 RepID=UPI0034CD2BA7